MCLHTETTDPPGFVVDSCEHGEAVVSIAHLRHLVQAIAASTCDRADCPGCAARVDLAVNIEGALTVASLEHDLQQQ